MLLKCATRALENIMTYKKIIGIWLFAVSLVSFSASAQNAKVTINNTVGAVSEYKFRGLSLSDSEPAVQAGSLVSYGGLSAGVWASTLSNRVTGADVEVDLYANYSVPLSKNWSVGVGGIAYLYAGGSNLDYGEISSSVSYSKNAFSSTMGVAYVPKQDNTGNADNIYVFSYGSYVLNNTFSLNGSLAYEDGAFGTNKWDWSFGISGSRGAASFQLSYIDTNVGGIGRGSLVGSVGWSF